MESLKNWSVQNSVLLESLNVQHSVLRDQQRLNHKSVHGQAITIIWERNIKEKKYESVNNKKPLKYENLTIQNLWSQARDSWTNPESSPPNLLKI